MPSLISNVLGGQSKDWRQMNERGRPSAPHPLTITAHTHHSQYPLKKWLRKASETTTNVKPEAPATADKRQKQTA